MVKTPHAHQSYYIIFINIVTNGKEKSSFWNKGDATEEAHLVVDERGEELTLVYKALEGSHAE